MAANELLNIYIGEYEFCKLNSPEIHHLMAVNANI